MIKKNIVTIAFLLLLALPSYASNWIQIGEKSYIDTASIRKYDTLNDMYSVWTKNLNDKKLFWPDLEKEFKKNLWYTKQQFILNCSTREIATKSTILYDLKEEVVSNYNAPLLDWTSVAPDTYGENLYSLVCGATEISIKKNEIYNQNPNIKIKVKHKRQ